MGRLRMSEASLSCGFLATAGATTLNYKSDSTLYYRVLDGELHGQITKGRNQYHFWISADHILFVPGGYVATFTAITAATVATQVVFDLLDVSAIGSLPSMLCPAPPVDYEPMEVPENIGWSKPKFAFNKRRRLSD
ncbi:hypothetical protein M433DRAFT_159174 [Acidomyces richmondensis BFW]|nr:hypothetical protein M433DRAFT_159174 [Acidomyces richmondensis BFW]